MWKLTGGERRREKRTRRTLKINQGAWLAIADAWCSDNEELDKAKKKAKGEGM
jgi:hypothetical protein